MRARVLLVEDDLSTLSALSFMFTHDEFDVLPCISAEEALVHVSSCDFDVAIVDMWLPGRAGAELAHDLRRRCPGVAIIFVTAEPGAESLKSLVPPYKVLRKPVDLPRLIDAVHAAAKQVEPEREGEVAG